MGVMDAALSVWDGTTETDVVASVWDGGTESPSTLSMIPAGYSSVNDMLAQAPFYVAHRGGSLAFPEMSLHSYTQSAMLGYGALELSMNRSSDGVWYGMHDQSIARTSGAPSALDGDKMTWAEIQEHEIIDPTGGPSKPYARAEDIINAYGRTHVLFVDPKYRHYDHRTEFFAMLKASLSDATDRMVLKYFGDATSLADYASDQGFATWGYYYQDTVQGGLFASTKQHWDIFGMDYGANATTWSEVTSVGKPVIGHIIPTLSAGSIALNRGAAGLMVSGVTEFDPTV